MKNRHFLTFPVVVSIAITGALGLATKSGAQTTRSWTTTTPNGDSGNWSDSTKWSGSDVPDTAGENATFGGYGTNLGGAGDGNRTVALDGDFTIGTLTIVPRTTGFTAKTFSLTGTNTLTLNTGFIVGGGTSVAIAPNLAIAADQTWTTQNETGAAPVTLNGIVSGPGKITRTANGANTGTSIITFSGANTFSGGLTQNAALNVTRLGSSSTVAGGVITDGPLGTGTVTLNAGTLSSSSGTARSLPNNIVIGGTVNLGNSSQNGALTFSDAGLTTPSTFTLGSATNNNVTILRVGNTNLTFDQVIAQSGGTNQSVNFASTSGTPTVTINRTKTAGGNILVGGVALALNNGAANPGSIIAVNGSVTATGTNKFSSGALISDAASMIATDAANYSAIAGGKAIVYNNGRASFVTDQTQATIASLFTVDSQVRLGLSSGALNPTVTENYDQSAIGNGRAGLVSASTGTVTYTGSLASGADNTFRVGGGLGTLALTNTTLTGASKNVIVEGGNTLSVTGNQDYTGTTTINATTATFSGASGALSGTSGITVNAAGTLNLTNNTGAVNANRIGDTVGLTLNNSLFALNGTSTTAASETLGDLTINSGGRNFITIVTVPGTSTVKTLQFGTLTRNNNAVAVFRGDTMGGTATARNEVKFSASPTLVGGGGAAGTTNISIVPWARGGNATSTGGSSGATTFVTYETNGVRSLATSEFVAASGTTTIDAAVGANTDRNVRVTSATTSGTTTINGASATPTVNSLLIDNTGATAAQTFSLNSGTVTVTSGAVHVVHSVTGQNLTLSTGTLAFGTAEAVITNNTGGALTSFNNTLTGSNGISIYAVGGGGIQIGGTNNITGGNGFVLGGNGFVGVDQDGRFGNSANNLTHAGGELRFFAGFSSTRGLALLGNVGSNTLGNNSSNTVTWTGNITGAGLLRLVNNASTASTAGFSLGGANNYSGGTQIEGINVTGTTNSAFGTGTVSLIGANNNAAALTLTGAAPTLGGLRGTDGTVTISTTDVSNVSTLTVGSNNDNTVFNGTIAQGVGKIASLTKSGSGTLVISGNNTYTGGTTVSSGTLNVMGSLSTGNVSVTGKLTGSGFIGGATTINSTGTHNAGGIGGAGKQTFSSSLDYATNSIFEWDLAATPSTTGRGTSYDAVNAASLGTTTGAIFRVVLNGAQDFSSSFWDTARQWTDIFKTSDLGTDLNIASIFTGGFEYYNGNGAVLGVPSAQGSFSVSGTTLTWSAVPEPTTALAGLLLGAGLLRRRRA